MPYCFSNGSTRTLRTRSPGGPMMTTLPSRFPAATTVSQSADPLAAAAAGPDAAGLAAWGLPEAALGFAAAALGLAGAWLGFTAGALEADGAPWPQADSASTLN